MTNTGLDMAHLISEKFSDRDYSGKNIPVTCNCGDMKDVISSEQYRASQVATLNAVCPNCKGQNRD